MNTLAQQFVNIIEDIAPAIGHSASLQSDSGANAVTVVFELGPETLSRLDRLLAVVENGV